jgi:hypothetical protein
MLKEESIRSISVEIKRANSCFAIHHNFIVKPGAFHAKDGLKRPAPMRRYRKAHADDYHTFQLTRGFGDPVKLAQIEVRDRELLAAWKLARQTPGTPEWDARLEMGRV